MLTCMLLVSGDFCTLDPIAFYCRIVLFLFVSHSLCQCIRSLLIIYINYALSCSKYHCCYRARATLPPLCLAERIIVASSYLHC
ncbi:hypothetical protein BYT27DRAFT_6875087 [Phlegmacium glaucopus]|nr:hypothetical protein BYT27DRAFT_6875087 [Phlegmacium glaucopus]